jgi:hypothetical protein
MVESPMAPYGILALTPEHIRMLSAYPRVPRDENGKPNVAVWAHMVDMPVRRVKDLARGLEELGAILADGTMPAMVTTYLKKLATDRLTH